MKLNATAAALGFALVAGFASPLSAQSEREIITARQPAGIVIALRNAGYAAELSEDDLGDPLISASGEGYRFYILFYGCNETSHDNCDSLQLRVGYERTEPWTAAEAMVIAKKYRYGAVALDDEGDPFLNWDIVTGDGIPAAVFLDSVSRFEETADLAGKLIFADQD